MKLNYKQQKYKQLDGHLRKEPVLGTHPTPNRDK